MLQQDGGQYPRCGGRLEVAGTSNRSGRDTPPSRVVVVCVGLQYFNMFQHNMY